MVPGRGRGGRGGHEPRHRIQAREYQAFDLSLQGKSQIEIASALGISQPAVSKLLRRIEDRHVKEMPADLRRLRVRMIARFDHVYAEAMQAFDRSKRPTHRRLQRKMLGVGQGESTVAELITEEGSGDPRHLEVGRRTLADLWKLTRLDTVPMADAPPAGSLAHLSREELKARMRQLINMLQAEETCEQLSPETPFPVVERPRPLTAEQAYEEKLARRAQANHTE